ncbi:transposase [Mycobacterium sp. E136]|uniref:transposase n=1 Tax=Mycobacterium sp. E136 TaxID=1834125 RepID=UPI000A059997
MAGARTRPRAHHQVLGAVNEDSPRSPPSGSKIDRDWLPSWRETNWPTSVGRSPGCAAARVKNPRTRPASRPRTSWPVPSCGPLSAAEIVAETAGVQRFPTEAAFARFAGVAPSPSWSGATQGRWRYIKTGNRQINAALRIPRNKGAMVLTAGWHLQMTHTVHSDIRVSVGLETWCRCGGKVCRAAGGSARRTC